MHTIARIEETWLDIKKGSLSYNIEPNSLNIFRIEPKLGRMPQKINKDLSKTKLRVQGQNCEGRETVTQSSYPANVSIDIC